MKTIEIHSLEETNALAEALAAKVFPGLLVTLKGDLGAGKTTFTKAFGRSLGVKKTINSPTFNILKIYQGSLPFYHIDAYRLEGITQDLGFEEVFADEGVCVVEWPQYIEYTLPKERLELTITNQEGEKRLIMINGIGERYRKLEEEL